MTILQELRRRARESRFNPMPTRHKRQQLTPLSLQKSGGPGTELREFLRRFNFDLSYPGCKCTFHAHVMDRLGPTWCEKNIPTIRTWLQTELDKQQAAGSTSKVFAFLARFGIDTVINIAIKRSRKKGAVSRIFLIGYPGKMGGANTEALHTFALWREMGLEVNLVPTWSCDPETEAQMTELGYITHHVQPSTLAFVPNLSDSVTVGMCNSHYMNAMGTLKEINCKIVWINCMTFMFAHERQAFQKWGCPDAMVYQSNYQRTCLERSMASYGYDPTTGHTIHGAFDPALFPYRYNPRPNPETDPFIVGKLARPDADKWPGNLWKVYEAINHPHRRARIMGCRGETMLKIGPTPEWAESLEPMKESSTDFLASLHCCVAPNGGAAENWSRIGLECMATGVPLVVPDAWGWQEMVRHGETGFLAKDDTELSAYATQLAHDEPLRQRMAEAARKHLIENLADSATLATQWEALLYNLYERDEPLFAEGVGG